MSFASQLSFYEVIINNIQVIISLLFLFKTTHKFNC
jgi:hypothetical protein